MKSRGLTPTLVAAAQVGHMAVSVLCIVAAVLDQRVRETGFAEKGPPPPVKLWEVLTVDEPGAANSVIIALAVCCAACAIRCLTCNPYKGERVCASCGYPAGAAAVCSECGGTRAVRTGEAAFGRWARRSALCLLVTISAPWLDDVLDVAFGGVRWMMLREYFVADFSNWPLGFEFRTLATVVVWASLTLLVAAECMALRRSSRWC